MRASTRVILLAFHPAPAAPAGDRAERITGRGRGHAPCARSGELRRVPHEATGHVRRPRVGGPRRRRASDLRRRSCREPPEPARAGPRREKCLGLYQARRRVLRPIATRPGRAPDGSCPRARSRAGRTASSRSGWCARTGGRPWQGVAGLLRTTCAGGAPLDSRSHGRRPRTFPSLRSARSRTGSPSFRKRRAAATWTPPAATPMPQAAREGQADRARARRSRCLRRHSFQETDPFAVHRAHEFGIERNRPAGRTA